MEISQVIYNQMKLFLLATALFASSALSLKAESHKLETSNIRAAPAASESVVKAPEGNFNSADQTACKKNGGRYRKDGLAGFYTCVKGYKDAFKPCTKSDDCQGDCIVTETQSPVPYCQPTDSKFGCWNTVENFNNGEPILCRD